MVRTGLTQINPSPPETESVGKYQNPKYPPLSDTIALPPHSKLSLQL